MKNFDLKNTGILLAIMLVAGAVLVGPVSAFAEQTESSASDYFWVSALGDNHPNYYYTSYSGYAWTKSDNNAGEIYVKAQIFEANDVLKFSDRDTQYNVQDLEVSGNYRHPNEILDTPYAKATMKSKNPQDIGFAYAYHI